LTSGSAVTVACPRCATPLGRGAGAWREPCPKCGAAAPSLGGVPCVFPNPEAWLVAWRRQLATFDEQVRRSWALLDAASARPGLTETTRRRLDTFRASSAAQLEEVHALLDPLLLAAPSVGPEDRDARPLTHYLDLVYRDWAWEAQGGGEVALGLAELEAVAGAGPLGRVLILGAGACRLAYELHRRPGTTETFALDVDLLLVAAARRIISCERLVLTEAPTEANDLDALVMRHELVAPAGPLDASFQLVLANGLEPPFAPGQFDTVVTPWFIDVATADLPALMATIARLLAPGGRWVNVGPVVYTHRVPFEARFTAQEVVALARTAGFAVGPPRLTTVPYAMSPLNGRGRLERTLAFEAVKR
jgi:SAM-dependent methyltransferase